MDIKKYNNRGLSGLCNLGNTCYINTATQLLSNTIILNEILDRVDISKLRLDKDLVIIKEYNALRKILWNKNVTVEPRRYIKVIQQISKLKNKDIFSGFAQNDTVEFLFMLMDSMHESFKINNYSEFMFNAKDKAYLMFLKNHLLKEFSIIDYIFTCVTKRKIISENTNKVLSKSYDKCTSISLGVDVKMKELSIYILLDEYFKNEILGDDNKYYNEDDDIYETAIIKNTIYIEPRILFFNIKRFNNNLTKNRKLFKIDEEIDIYKYLEDDRKKIHNNNCCLYELYGIAMHSGGIQGGHYWALIKNLNNKWYEFNDREVKEINIDRIQRSYIYCLFYKKK